MKLVRLLFTRFPFFFYFSVQAACRIQALQRGRIGRKKAVKKREEVITKHQAAIKIQSVQRGRQTRKKINVGAGVYGGATSATSTKEAIDGREREEGGEEESEDRRKAASATKIQVP